MRKYETIVVLDSETGEAQVKAEAEKIENFLKEQGAQNIQAVDWGKREIAYLVNKKRYGSYICFRYETSNYELVQEAMRTFRINDAVMKFQSHLISDSKRKFKGSLKNVGEEAAA